MFNSDQKRKIVKAVIKEWAINQFGFIGAAYEPTEEIIQETINEFDNDPGTWEEIESQLREMWNDETVY